MEKQHNQIRTIDLIHVITKLKQSSHSKDYIIQHLFWLQDNIISEVYNFHAINSVLMKYKLRDVNSAPFTARYGEWRANGHQINNIEVSEILDEIEHNLVKVLHFKK